MNAADLARSATTASEPPSGLSPALTALWFAKAGRWHDAHDLCQEIPGTTGSWIHAWLHREEGDQSNAEYWYARAKKPVPPRGKSLADEWLEIVTALS
jgi:hypothetical protein